MSQARSPPPPDANAEVDALILTLQQAEQRLKTLTGGELDSIADSDGRTFLLQRAQEHLVLNQAAKQAAILNALPAHIALLDPEGQIISVNEAWRHFAGSNALQSPGQGLGLNYLHACDSAAGNNSAEAHHVAAGIRAILSGAEKSFSLQYPCHSSTAQNWFLLKVMPLPGDPPQGAVVMHINITEQQMAMDNLAANEVLLRQFIQHTPAAIAMLDTEMRYLQISERWLQDYHLTGQEIIGKSHYEIFQDVPQRWKDIHQRVLAGAVEQCDEDPFPRADGSTEWLQWEARPWRKAGGEIGGVIFFTQVITERKHAEQALQRQQTELRALFDLMPAMIWFKDTENRILRVNQRVADAAGKSVEEIEGKPSVEIYPQDAAKYFADDSEVIRSGMPKLGIVERLQGSEGKDLWVQTDKVPYRDKDAKVIGIVVMAQDISERKRTEQALRERQEHFRFLNNLGEATRALADPAQIMAVMTGMLGEHLGASRCAYADVDKDGDRFTILHDYTDGCASTVGNYQLALFGARAVTTLNSGQTLVIRNVKAELQPDAGADMFSAIGIQAIITCPLVNGGRLRAMMAVHQSTPRDWQPGEIALVQEVVARCWATIERRNAEEELKFKNTILQTQQQASPDAILVVDENAKILSYNQQFIDLWQISPQIISAGVDAAVLQSVIDQVENSAAFVARVQYLYEHRDARSQEEILLKDGRIIDRHSAPTIGADGKYYGRVWYFRDVSESKQAALLIKESEQRLKLATESAHIGIWDWNVAADQMVWDAQMYALYGIREQDFSGAVDAWKKGLHPEDRAQAEADIATALSGTKDFDSDFRVVWPSGEIRNIQAHATVQRASNGAAERMIGVNWDITDRKQAEARIKYLNRVYAMLGSINALIIRVRDRDELFREACLIAVAEGGFRMAWIGIVDWSAMKIVPVASTGVAQGILTAIEDSFSLDAAAPMGNTLTAQSIREKTTIVSNDSQNDPTVMFNKEYAAAGICSLAIFPLIVADKTVGVLVLYASEMEFFHAEELKVLKRLADDIAFGIDHIDKQDQLNYLAYYDPLTGLANRSLFHNRLSQSLHARGTEQPRVATALINIERFRRVNETLGRDIGDELLRQLGARLLHANDTAARIGVDIYGLILRGGRTAAEVNRTLGSIINACVTEPFMLGGQELRVACRVGVALYPGDGADADALLSNAEAAVQRSKHSAERIVFYAPEMNAKVAESLAIETRLRRALDRREFVLHYQPKLSLASGRLIGAEALIRWQDPNKGLVPPGLFIPVLEETGMIIEVGYWVVAQAFADLHAWSARGTRVPRVAVNVSALQLQSKNFIDSMIEEIQRGGDHPEWLELEITESMVMGNIEENIRKLSILRGMGVTIAIDDFGTGYSSLSYLSRLPIDTLKIDQSFVSSMTKAGDATSIVSTIITLAHGLKLKVVAEGVETEEQLNMLKQLGCDEAQGYFFSKPLPGELFAAKYLTASTDA